ncbi:hypothetical protein JB92DRAFT_2832014 [Gautieria morchelliformis]|nr:hypothetical protein JB92DRAFT_2832014 [Gautieria morchelliformis]
MEVERKAAEWRTGTVRCWFTRLSFSLSMTLYGTQNLFSEGGLLLQLLSVTQPITNQSTSSEPASRTTFSFESPSGYSDTVEPSSQIPDESLLRRRNQGPRLFKVSTYPFHRTYLSSLCPISSPARLLMLLHHIPFFIFTSSLLKLLTLLVQPRNLSASGTGDPEVCAQVLLRDGRVLWGVSSQMQRACIVALVTRFVEVLASPAASVDETHVPKLYGICTGSCSMPR